MVRWLDEEGRAGDVRDQDKTRGGRKWGKRVEKEA
jgi:hypothetical protein